jgi:hypothetical protein
MIDQVFQSMLGQTHCRRIRCLILGERRLHQNMTSSNW